MSNVLWGYGGRTSIVIGEERRVFGHALVRHHEGGETTLTNFDGDRTITVPTAEVREIVNELGQKIWPRQISSVE